MLHIEKLFFILTKVFVNKFTTTCFKLNHTITTPNPNFTIANTCTVNNMEKRTLWSFYNPIIKKNQVLSTLSIDPES